MPSKKVVKCNLTLKSARIAAGYDNRNEFVAAINTFLEDQGVTYRVKPTSYILFERGVTKEISFYFAYYISEFLHCPIDLFANEKICQT